MRRRWQLPTNIVLGSNGTRPPSFRLWLKFLRQTRNENVGGQLVNQTSLTTSLGVPPCGGSQNPVPTGGVFLSRNSRSR
jgi:hypothetical protein